jgi:hypothetical protein
MTDVERHWQLWHSKILRGCRSQRGSYTRLQSSEPCRQAKPRLGSRSPDSRSHNDDRAALRTVSSWSLPFSHSPYRAYSSMTEVFSGRTSMLRTLSVLIRATCSSAERCARTDPPSSSGLRLFFPACSAVVGDATDHFRSPLDHDLVVYHAPRKSRQAVKTFEKCPDSGKARPHLPELPLSRSTAPLKLNSSLLPPSYISAT